MDGRITNVLHRVNAGETSERKSDLATGIDIDIRSLQCPATVSVLGALASQEAIKACSNVHTPLSQTFLFESLDSLSSSLCPGDDIEVLHNRIHFSKLPSSLSLSLPLFFSQLYSFLSRLRQSAIEILVAVRDRY